MAFVKELSTDGSFNFVSSIKDEFGEAFFSKQPCECCIRPLGGNRFSYIFATNNGRIIEANICGDCEHYLAYGDLDDASMEEMKLGLDNGN